MARAVQAVRAVRAIPLGYSLGRASMTDQARAVWETEREC